MDISDAVATLTFRQVVDSCFDTGALCENLIRNTEGTLSLVIAPYLNLDNASVTGVDIEMQYRYEPNFFSNED